MITVIGRLSNYRVEETHKSTGKMPENIIQLIISSILHSNLLDASKEIIPQMTSNSCIVVRCQLDFIELDADTLAKIEVEEVMPTDIEGLLSWFEQIETEE